MRKHKMQRHLTTKQRIFINLLSLIEVVVMVPITLHIINTTFSVARGLEVFFAVSIVYLAIVLFWVWRHDKKLAKQKERVKND